MTAESAMFRAVASLAGNRRRVNTIIRFAQYKNRTLLYAAMTTRFHSFYCSLCIVVLSVVLVVLVGTRRDYCVACPCWIWSQSVLRLTRCITACVSVCLSRPGPPGWGARRVRRRGWGWHPRGAGRRGHHGRLPRAGARRLLLPPPGVAASGPPLRERRRRAGDARRLPARPARRPRRPRLGWVGGWQGGGAGGVCFEDPLHRVVITEGLQNYLELNHKHLGKVSQILIWNFFFHDLVKTRDIAAVSGTRDIWSINGTVPCIAGWMTPLLNKLVIIVHWDHFYNAGGGWVGGVGGLHKHGRLHYTAIPSTENYRRHYIFKAVIKCVHLSLRPPAAALQATPTSCWLRLSCPRRRTSPPCLRTASTRRTSAPRPPATTATAACRPRRTTTAPAPAARSRRYASGTGPLPLSASPPRSRPRPPPARPPSRTPPRSLHTRCSPASKCTWSTSTSGREID